MRMKLPTVHVAILAFASGVLGPVAFAQQPAAAPVSAPSADNSKVNQRDKSAETKKPTDQPNNRDDIQLVAAVRRSIVKDRSLSTMAHNVKIVAVNGVVTLRGPVLSESEKAKVAVCAKTVPSVSQVDNQLDVKTK